MGALDEVVVVVVVVMVGAVVGLLEVLVLGLVARGSGNGTGC